MGKLLTKAVGKVLTKQVGKVLDIYTNTHHSWMAFSAHVRDR